MSFTQQKEDKEIEEALVRDFQSGNLEAYDKIAGLYQQKIYALSFNLVRNQMDAQDVTQEVLLTLFRKINTFQGKSAFSSWVYRITLNASYMKLRSKKEAEIKCFDTFANFFYRSINWYADTFDKVSTSTFRCNGSISMFDDRHARTCNYE